MTKGPQRLALPTDVPPEFGTTPIPEGMIRFNHYTRDPANLPRIMSEGLLRKHAEESYARGGSESPQIFATAGEPDAGFKRSHNFVEGWADPSRKTSSGEFGQMDIGENWRGDPPAEHAAYMEGRRNTITFRGDVPAHQMIAAHEPWHEDFRSIQRHPNVESDIVAGKFDDTFPSEALSATKTALAAKVMLGGRLGNWGD